MKELPADLIERVQLMEKLSNTMEQATAELSDALTKWQSAQDHFAQVVDYYQSETWLSDVEISDHTTQLEGIPHGVLSEDWICNLISDNYQMALEILRSAVSSLE